MNKKTIYFYPKFLEFQIMCRRPQLTPSRAMSLRPLL